MEMFGSFDGLLWLLVSLLVLTILQRFLHREIQAFLLVLSRNPKTTQVVFAFIFLPGVFLHELSHYLMAKILRVPTGRFSLLPQVQRDGKLRLGYVETASGGFIRDALIGLAPLISGCIFIAMTAKYWINLLPLWEYIQSSDWNQLWEVIRAIPQIPSFWLWFYLAFTISSMMMPSASDRHAWLPVILLAIGLIGLAILAGAGEWMVENLAPMVNEFLHSLALIFGLSAIIHVLLIMPFFLLHTILAKVTHVDVG
jgi:hypothetical protein